MNRTVVPSVFSYNEKDYRKRFELALRLSRRIHLDVMDGNFVPFKSPNLSGVYGLGRDNEIDVHLMVRKPEEYLEEMKRMHAKRVYIHIESEKPNDLLKTMQIFKSAGFIVGVAINPETPADSLIPFSFHAEACLVMGVHPGKEGQAFILGTYNKLREVYRYMQGKEILVDGGVHDEVISNLRNYNVNALICGSSVFNSDNPVSKLDSIKKAFF